jgi:hypothetical protein
MPSELYILVGKDREDVNRRFAALVDGIDPRDFDVARSGHFSLLQLEDIDTDEVYVSTDDRVFAIVASIRERG